MPTRLLVLSDGRPETEFLPHRTTCRLHSRMERKKDEKTYLDDVDRMNETDGNDSGGTGHSNLSKETRWWNGGRSRHGVGFPLVHRVHGRVALVGSLRW